MSRDWLERGDPDVAGSFACYAVVGIEGLVVKGGAQAYSADRIW